MGEALSDILDDGIGLLRTVTRKHFGPAYTALAPLGQLTLDHVDQDEVVALFDQMIALEALPSDDLVALDEDGLNVFRDMIRELHEFRAAIAEASSDAFRQVLEQRFAESIGGTGLVSVGSWRCRRPLRARAAAQWMVPSTCTSGSRVLMISLVRR